MVARAPVTRLVLAALGICLFVALVAAPASGLATEAIQLVPAWAVGEDVDELTDGFYCRAVPSNECGSGAQSAAVGGFTFIGSVALNTHTGELYLADTVNQRLQVFSSEGEFLSVFGANRLTYPSSVAVDPRQGDVYILEIDGRDVRVDRYGAGGQFVWARGEGVNQTSGSELCTAEEIRQHHVRCGPGTGLALSGMGSEAGIYPAHYGNLLAFGGPEELLYAGDEGVVDEFQPNGRLRRRVEIPGSPVVGNFVLALAVDAHGDVFVVDERFEAVVREIGPAGGLVAQYQVHPRTPGGSVKIDALAVDEGGDIAVTVVEDDPGASFFGDLFSGSQRGASEFAVPVGNDGAVFGPQEELFVAAADGQELLVYKAMPISAALTSPLLCLAVLGQPAAYPLGCPQNFRDYPPWPSSG